MDADPLAALAAQLRVEEDSRLFVYDDATGKPLRPGMTLVGWPTIGVGRNLATKGISPLEERLLLDHDMDEAITDLSSFAWFLDLDGVRQGACADLRFWAGVEGFRAFKKFIAAMSRKDYPEASLELKNAKIAQEDPERVARMCRQIETGER